MGGSRSQPGLSWEGRTPPRGASTPQAALDSQQLYRPLHPRQWLWGAHATFIQLSPIKNAKDPPRGSPVLCPDLWPSQVQVGRKSPMNNSLLEGRPCPRIWNNFYNTGKLKNKCQTIYIF